MKGAGIALALSLASFINTIALLVFMKKGKNIDVNSVVKSTLLYAIKMIILSLIALVPIYLLKPIFSEIFQGKSRFISQGIPVVLSAIIFAIVGIFLLIITKDSLVKSIGGKVKSKINR
jgi:putative peptidoglycan lipid II flippase